MRNLKITAFLIICATALLFLYQNCGNGAHFASSGKLDGEGGPGDLGGPIVPGPGCFGIVEFQQERLDTTPAPNYTELHRFSLIESSGISDVEKDFKLFKVKNGSPSNPSFPSDYDAVSILPSEIQNDIFTKRFTIGDYRVEAIIQKKSDEGEIVCSESYEKRVLVKEPEPPEIPGNPVLPQVAFDTNGTTDPSVRYVTHAGDGSTTISGVEDFFHQLNRVKIRLLNGPWTSDVKVRVSIVDGSGKVGRDYVGDERVVTIPAGQIEVFYNFKALEEDLYLDEDPSLYRNWYIRLARDTMDLDIQQVQQEIQTRPNHTKMPLVKVSGSSGCYGASEPVTTGHLNLTNSNWHDYILVMNPNTPLSGIDPGFSTNFTLSIMALRKRNMDGTWGPIIPSAPELNIQYGSSLTATPICTSGWGGDIRFKLQALNIPNISEESTFKLMPLFVRTTSNPNKRLIRYDRREAKIHVGFRVLSVVRGVAPDNISFVKTTKTSSYQGPEVVEIRGTQCGGSIDGTEQARVVLPVSEDGNYRFSNRPLMMSLCSGFIVSLGQVRDRDMNGDGKIEDYVDENGYLVREKDIFFALRSAQYPF